MSKSYDTPPVPTTSLKDRAAALAEQTSGAYSADRYAHWPSVIMALLKQGYTDREVEAVVTSKWTRWAADASGKAYGTVAAKHLTYWMDKVYGDKLRLEVSKLTAEYFGAEETAPIDLIAQRDEKLVRKAVEALSGHHGSLYDKQPQAVRDRYDHQARTVLRATGIIGGAR